VTNGGLDRKDNGSAPGDIDVYLSGARLYGDDFDQSQIAAWFEDEKEGYFELGANAHADYRYGYHAINHQHGFRWLGQRSFRHVLGMGSAYGEELKPIAGRSREITILEPADGFEVREIDGVPVKYVKPQASGRLPFADQAFDLITCFGVLHHIPNVSTVIGEMSRCLAPGGFALIREPTISMGDWRVPRRGLTRRERGIPLGILRDAIRSAGLEVYRERKCMFSLTPRIFRPFVRDVYNSRVVVQIDQLFGLWPFWSTKYHATNVLEKFRFSSVFIIAHKKER
jgi:SAM-dependent methyltransferase